MSICRKNLLSSLPVLAAGVLCTTGIASAQGTDNDKTARSTSAIDSERWYDDSAEQGGIAGLLDEDFETGFPVGLLDGINGWQAGDFGGNGYITDTGVGAGFGLLTAMHASDGTALGGFEMDSPDFGPAFGTVSADVRITGAGSLYQFVVLDTGNFFFITRINFETDGRITIGQTDPDPDNDGFTFFDTGFTWTVNVATRICVTNESDGSLAVFVDGDLALLGISASANAFAEGDTMTAPSGIGRIMTFTDNAGMGNVLDGGTPADPFDDKPDGTGDNYVIDNVGGDGTGNDSCEAGGPADCFGDTDGNLVIDIDDIVNIVLDFGCTDPPGPCPGDVNMSGVVDIDDVVDTILVFGTVCAPGGLSNDLCEDRLDIFFGGTTNFGSGDTLAGGASACGVDETTDVWFNFYVLCNGTITIDTIGSTYNTILEVYGDSMPGAGDGHDCPPLTLVACDDDGAVGSVGDMMDPCDPANLDSAVIDLPVLAGALLKIRVIGSDFPDSQAPGLCPGIGAGDGTLNIVVTCDVPPPPANDDCVNAEVVAVMSGGMVSIDAQTETANADPLDTFPCGDPLVFTTGDAGVWYSVQGTGNTMTATMCGTAAADQFDAALYVYCGATTDCASEQMSGETALLCAAADDDGCGMLGDGTVSTVTWCSSAAQNYMILVTGFAAGDAGNFNLVISDDGAGCAPAASCDPPPMLANDNCIDQIPILQGLTAYSNVQATTDGPAMLDFCGDLAGDGGQTTEDIWYVYTATAAVPMGADQVVLVTTCEELGGSANHDTDIVLYEGTSCVEADLLANVVACNDDDPANACGTGAGGFKSTIITPVTPGTDYLVRLGSWNTGNQGSGQLLISQFEPTNDLCDFASDHTVGPMAVEYDTTGAGVDVAELCSGASAYDAPGIWLTVVGDGTSYTITTCSISPAFWDTRTTVYCGPCDEQGCVGENSDNALACGPNETLTWCTFPGFTYTILITGNGAAAFSEGTVDVTIDSDGMPCAGPACLPPDECGGDYYRPRIPPDGPWEFGTTDVNIDLLRIEDLGFDGTITTLRWWGIDARFVVGGGFADCDDNTVDFDISLYDADAMDPTLPDLSTKTQIYNAGVDGFATKTAADIYDPGMDMVEPTFQNWQWDVTLPVPVDVSGAGAEFISIQDTDDDVCLFLWLGSLIGGDTSVSVDQDPMSMQFNVPVIDGAIEDLSICINPTL